ncbi:TPA: DUF3800 domain-containing protein [Legionella anisa]
MKVPAFFLSFLYMNVDIWDKCFENFLNLRRQLKLLGLPTRMEFHSREFFLNKNPYAKLKLSNSTRIKIINQVVESISELAVLNVQAINIAIIKNRINGKYDVLEKAFTYGLTRIDTNLHKEQQKGESDRFYKYGKFLLLLDEGYLNKIRGISRKLYRYNYVPYKNSEDCRQIKLTSIVDDPLPKNSQHSYCIQTVDLIVYLISQFIYIKLDLNESPKRKRLIPDEKINEWIETLKPIFNLNACPKSEFGYGIVVHPKQ